MASVRQPRFTNPSWLLSVWGRLRSERTIPLCGAFLSSRGIAVAVALGTLASPATARAFERQWHVGAGGGLVLPSRGHHPGPAASLHAAYGLSDMFDARLELRSSLHEEKSAPRDDQAMPAPDEPPNSLSQLALGLAYKVDIIEWVPYLGVRAGYYRFGVAPQGGYARHGGMIGAVLGMDYAFSRSAAVGAEIDYDTLLPEGGALATQLHFEYRWGF